MPTNTEYLKTLITTAGGDASSLPDNLESTHYKALIEALANGTGGGGTSGGGSSNTDWTLVNSVITTEEVSQIVITEDSLGNKFSLDNVRVLLFVPQGAKTGAGKIELIGQWDTYRISNSNIVSTTYGEVTRTMYQRENISKTGRQFYYTNGNFTPHSSIQKIDRFCPAIRVIAEITTADVVFPVGTVMEVYKK